MNELILSKHDLCTGCNRCVRECPMETANITYLDEHGSIKVKIDSTKCINCGRCIAMCKHEARYYEDDTARFFTDLAAGVPISLIVAPSIRTNIPEYKRLFTYLKNAGANKIYDVSLGADVCIWAHIRYIEKNGASPMITQPCPVIVSYCKIYRHDLLERLSPIHSPMACVSIYMKEYEGITDKIAALSPCIAKSDEFTSTELAQYNVTFAKLRKYLEENKIELPQAETGFDHLDSGLGSVFPMPGGLKENIDFYFKKKVHVAESEGIGVFEKLDTYSETPVDLLPDIFDVLSCEEGCNIGSAVMHEQNIFEIDSSMRKTRNAEDDKARHEWLKELYKTYDEKLDLSLFMRKYKAIETAHYEVSEKDIENAFKLLGKTDYEKQHVDCSACGSATCYNMARKVALGVNIPSNCMVLAMETAKQEHELNLAAHEQIVAVEKQRIEAEAASSAKSAFLSTMSHEIRTPMNAILGITEFQLQDEKLDRNIKEALGKIYASGDMLLGIINDMLDLSKIESGKIVLSAERFELASLISDTAQLNIMRIGSKPIEFELFVDENMPANLMGDELRVKQILNNILSNAFKYTSAGTVKMSVTLDPGNSGDEKTINLLISISDTGQGMTKEQANQLFDEHSRFNMEANRTTEGTGLGMSITRNLVQLMNGSISVESEQGKGSTFTVRLPLGKVDSAVLGKEMADNLQQFRSSNTAQMKRVQITREPMPYGNVLIVDDVETNIFVAKGLMSPYGLKIDSAESGFEAIKKIEDGNVYDIIFMDHMMPQMDGIETVHIIRGRGYDQPIVALTANAVAGQADVFLQNGFDDFISKPIDVRQLNIVLNRLIRDKQPPEVIEAARRKSEEKQKKTQGRVETPAIDPRYAEVLARDARRSLAALEPIMAKNGDYSEDELKTYTIHVHGMKSALASIGFKELSAVAKGLELAVRNGDINAVTAETPAFIDDLRALAEKLAPSGAAEKDKATD